MILQESDSENNNVSNNNVTEPIGPAESFFHGCIANVTAEMRTNTENVPSPALMSSETVLNSQDNGDFCEFIENKLETKSNNSGNNTLKRRSLYSTLGPEQMGVPGSPVYDDSTKDDLISAKTNLDNANEVACNESAPAGYASSDCSDSDMPVHQGHPVEISESGRFFHNPHYDTLLTDSNLEKMINRSRNDHYETVQPSLLDAHSFATRSAKGCASDNDVIESSTTPPPRAIFWSSADRSLAAHKAGRPSFMNAVQLNEGLVRSPDSHDSGIHVEYNVERKTDLDDAYPANVETLPEGWEKCEDPSGQSYYWHVDSGTVQREPPVPLIDGHECRRSSRSVDQPHQSGRHVNSHPNSGAVTPEKKSPKRRSNHIDRSGVRSATFDNIALPVLSKSESESKSGSSKHESDSLKLPIRFAVRSLGWTEVNEDDLKQDRSARAVNKAIIDLSTGRKDIIDNVSKWGDGKELILELDDHDLRLIDPDSDVVLHTQPIYQIRVWGVGRDTGRDFAYVSRDRITQRYMCHVFRCDTPARTIANTLRDICKLLTLERFRATAKEEAANADDSGASPSRRPQARGSPRRRQTLGGLTALRLKSTSAEFATTQTTGAAADLPRSLSGGHANGHALVDSFPTPIEEPTKVVRCHFLGITQVASATGIDVLNDAIDRLVQQVKVHRWILCDVSISPSTITITEVGNELLAECRVRYLSFLGIGQEIKHCAFIMQSSMDTFMCYVFFVEPSAGAMAKTIEAACKLRYQKVLDAYGERRSSVHKGWTDTLRDVLGTFTGRRSSRPFSLHQR